MSCKIHIFFQPLYLLQASSRLVSWKGNNHEKGDKVSIAILKPEPAEAILNALWQGHRKDHMRL
jgi:hypothetical protein